MKGTRARASSLVSLSRTQSRERVPNVARTNMSVNGDKNIWKRSEIILFIQMYESLPELWNSNLCEYKDRDKKTAAVQKMSESFGVSTGAVRRKIHNLRCQYNAEVRKIKKKSADQGVDESQITSEWKFYEHMKFLVGAHCNERSPSRTTVSKKSVSIHAYANLSSTLT